MTFPAYPKYKPSGVEWLGDVPEHWQLKRLKWVTTVNDDVLTELDDPNSEIQYVDIGSVSLERGIEKTESMRFGDAPSRARRKVSDGDVIVSTVRTYLKAIAPIILPSENLVVSTGFAVVRPRQDFTSVYAKYALQCGYFVEEVISRSAGVSYPAINPSDMITIKLAIPTLEEQRAIAAFLDRETARIDSLVSEQERLIGLLQEKRQAVISHAVTKGLDPNATMKPSGVEWLGDVPDHWKICALKRLLIEPLMYGANESADDDTPGNPRFVRITDIDDNGLLRDETFKSLPPEIAKPYLLSDGDVLLARSGATVGKTFIYRDSWGLCCFAGYLIKARVNENVMNASYLYACCQSSFYWNYINSEQIQSTIQNVSAERYGNCIFPCPSVEEQRAIAAFLDRETARIDTLVEEARRDIELLKERRSAVISAAVTGKIDVWGVNCHPPTPDTHADSSVGMGNYTEERESLFAGMTLDDIIMEMKNDMDKPIKRGLR